MGVLGILEAVEILLSYGWAPSKRTIYLSFGHDEEVGGSGARMVAQLLEERGVKLKYALDEGGLINEGGEVLL